MRGLATGVVVCLCLLMGGVTLGALLLAGVQQRIPEIGLRRALGASKADIAGLFMVEALLVAVSGTVTGGLVAAFLLHVFRSVLPVVVVVNFGTLAWPVVCGLVLAALAGYLPARAAARIAPAEALRND